ncbi:hypothetical protein COCON_G00051160 [Conger conger]|uniref:Uncharacterized protein n=1 Tax=Conger conger TaxID=82655 RepID=A0A9Q1I3U1_CONCO|nr:hypothetical protein COCON_G00051160 [Conger conger]
MSCSAFILARQSRSASARQHCAAHAQQCLHSRPAAYGVERNLSAAVFDAESAALLIKSPFSISHTNYTNLGMDSQEGSTTEL